MPPLTIMLKPASSACNMACSYCFYHDESNKRSVANYGMMSENTLREIIRKTIFRAEKSISYMYQGGEPLLRGIDFFQKAIELQQKYNKNQLMIYNALQTNATLITEEWCQFFAKNNFLIGVSVDGTPSVHNSNRVYADGQPTYNDIEHAINLLEKYHIEYNILTVVTKNVTDNIEDIYRFYKSKNWMYQQYILCLPPLGEAPSNQAYSPTPTEYGTFLIQLYDMWCKDIANNPSTAPSIRQFENYKMLQMGIPAESCDMRGNCSNMLVVESDGSAYPCDFFMTDEYKLGNFHFDRLDDFDQKRKELAFVEKSKLHSNQCLNCEYHWLCRCGCQRVRFQVPSENRYMNYYCESFKMFFDHVKSLQ